MERPCCLPLLFLPPPSLAGVHHITEGQGWEALGAYSERRWVNALAELKRLPQAVATNVRSHTFAERWCGKFSSPSGGEA